MAKKSNKKLLGMILSLATLVFAVLVVVMFFVPTINSKDSDTYNYSACTICFVSAEKAGEKAEEAVKSGNVKESTYWTVYKGMKESDNYKGKLNFTAWMEFTATVAALVVIVALILAMFKMNTSLIAILSAVVMFGASLAAIIGLGALMDVAVMNVKFSESFKFGAATIVSLISSILGAGAIITKKVLKA